MSLRNLARLGLAALFLTGLVAGGVKANAADPAAPGSQGPGEILNVTYDVGRELFGELNPVFQKAWQEKTSQPITVNQSFGGTSKQARSILEGLQADTVTFNQVTDVQILHDKGGLIAADWQSKFPNKSSPFYSLPSFLVRAGNPKNIRDWDDLIRDDVKVIFPNPKTSGNARYTYLAATAYALRKFDGDQAKATEFVQKIFLNVPVFDAGGRASTTTFVEREIGDVLITFEAEVQGIRKEFGLDKYDAVTPSLSLLAEFPVAVVDQVADKRGSRAVATAYLDFLYSKAAQEIIAAHAYRVNDAAILATHATNFPPVELVTVEDVFGGWDKVAAEHFASGGLLDQAFVNQ
ncbi:sulfate transport system substrate-binding protein [Dongia mobilis]|uniref:Sulfate transport system substrate-binding protein n=1 Tax=Dongia mobilis TaxID=578943 RepID=A0A4R6WTF4_9PROT|nr:thiosulfate ABC transporter substrate-binding protein CysP [Dongia mobilis]TDQ86420.1 sulfate transport system substrate-binding protein [Dongia mobilis]